MSRPLKEIEELQRNLVKAYLTDHERDLLDEVCSKLNCSFSRAIVLGIYFLSTSIENGDNI